MVVIDTKSFMKAVESTESLTGATTGNEETFERRSAVVLGAFVDRNVPAGSIPAIQSADDCPGYGLRHQGPRSR